MRIRSFAFVGHPVENIRRARAFYEKVFNLPPPKGLDGKIDDDLGWVEYEIGPHTLALTTAWSQGKRPEQPSSGLVVEVEDFEAALEHLEECGVELEMGPWEFPTCSMAVLLDPDGNRIGIHQLK